MEGELATEDGVIHEVEALHPHPGDGLPAEPGPVWNAQAVLVQEAVDPVLHQPQPVAEELPSASLLLVGDVAGEEHLGPQQPGVLPLGQQIGPC